MNGPVPVLAVGLAVLALLLCGGWLLHHAPSQLDRAVAALALDGEPDATPGLRPPRERHRSERARRPARRPSRPVSYDW